MAREPLSAYTETHRYRYRNERGALRFEKLRFELLDPMSGLRSKTFRYRDPATGRLQKPYDADMLVYRLPEVREGIAEGQTVHWCEGEKDADALAGIGIVATSHHQGAGRAHPLQASSISDARRIRLWVDKDPEHPEVGAYDAWRRFTLLVDAGMDSGRIVFWRAPGPWRGRHAVKDPADMLAAGYSLDDAVQCGRDKVRDIAMRFTPAAGRRSGYEMWANPAARTKARNVDPHYWSKRARGDDRA